MANFSAAKRGLAGIVPPKPEDTKDNLATPEVAPSRKREKTVRTKAFTTKITPDFHKKIKLAAVESECDMGEILEIAFNFWLEQQKPK